MNTMIDTELPRYVGDCRVCGERVQLAEEYFTHLPEWEVTPDWSAKWADEEDAAYERAALAHEAACLLSTV